MVTASTASSTPVEAAADKAQLYAWEGTAPGGHAARGELHATSEHEARALLRRQGITPGKISRRWLNTQRAITPKDIALFTRQFATMMKAGVPVLQSLDIVARGHANPGIAKLLGRIRDDIEAGSSMSAAFRKHPQYFDHLYCSLVEAGETGGVLDELLERLALYLEKIQAIRSKIRAALMYPAAVMATAVAVVAIIMIFVIPAFRDVFGSFGAQLPGPTLFVISVSEFLARWWWLLALVIGTGVYFLARAIKRSPELQARRDRLLLKLPIFGKLIDKSCIARWTRTLATMFAAGVPMVEALDSVGGAAGNIVYAEATRKIQQDVATGSSLTAAMTRTQAFPHMVLQMSAIGEESGTVDTMLAKAADFYEAEVNDAVAGLSSLLEPLIIVFLGVVIGGLVIAMYLPIFQLGQVV